MDLSFNINEEFDSLDDNIEASFTASVRQGEPQNPSTKRKRQEHSGSSRGSQRGANWGEDDSILLVRAYKYAEDQKKSTGAILELCQLILRLGNKRYYAKQDV